MAAYAALCVMFKRRQSWFHDLPDWCKLHFCLLGEITCYLDGVPCQEPRHDVFGCPGAQHMGHQVDDFERDFSLVITLHQ